MNSEHHPEESRGANDGMMIILLLMLVLLALGAGGFFFFMASSRVVEHQESGPAPVISNTGPAPSKVETAPEDSPFTDDDTKPVPPVVSDASPAPSSAPSPISNEQWTEAAQLAVAKKLNLTDNVAWGEVELSKASDGTITVAGPFTADGMSRKFSCKIRAEQVDGKTVLKPLDVSVE